MYNLTAVPYRLVKRVKDAKAASPAPVCLDLWGVWSDREFSTVIPSDLKAYPNLKGMRLRAEFLPVLAEVRGLDQIESLMIEDYGSWKVNQQQSLRSVSVLQSHFGHIKYYTFFSHHFEPALLTPRLFPDLERLHVRPGRVKDWKAFFSMLGGFGKLVDLKADLPVKKYNQDFEVEDIDTTGLFRLKSLNLTGGVKKALDLRPMQALESLVWIGTTTRLPAGLGGLKELKKLNLRIGAKRLPKRMACEPILEELHLGGNLFVALPEFLTRLPSLKKLNLAKGRFYCPPDWEANLPQLEALNITGNTNVHLHKAFFDLPNLRELIADLCKIEALPEMIGNMKQLEVLRLRHNKLVELPEMLSGLTELKELDCSENQLQAIPDWLLGLPRLTKLKLGGNPIKWPGGVKLSGKLSRLIGEPDWGTWNPEKRTIAFRLLLGQAEGTLSEAFLAQLVKLKLHPLSSNAYDRLTALSQDPFTEPLPETIRLWGHPEGYTDAETHSFCEKLGIRVVKTDDAALHFVSQARFEKYEELTSRGKKLCYSFHLKKFFRAHLPGFLITSSTEKQLKRFQALLDGKLREGRILAFRMMRTGGMPDKLKSEMIGIAFFDPDQKIRKLAIDLLDRYQFELVQKVIRQIGRRALIMHGMPRKAGYLWDFLMQSPEIDAIAFQKMAVHYQIYIPKRHRALAINGVDYFMNMVREGSLGLNNLGLKALPPAVTELDQLESLILIGNQLESLPEEIGNLVSLKLLVLKENKLKSLPESIGKLRQLEVLDLSSNALKTLPKTIGQLKQLKELNLQQNPIGTLPANIGEADKLETLNLSWTALKSLPVSIGKLKNLKVLTLSGTHLKTLPASIGNLENLQEIEVISNTLQALPPEMGQLKSLEKARFNCVLDNFPRELGALPALKELQIENSNFELDLLPSAFPGSVALYPALETLHFARYEGVIIQSGKGQLPRLKSLSVRLDHSSQLSLNLTDAAQLESLTIGMRNPGLFPESILQHRTLKRLTITVPAMAFPEKPGDWPLLEELTISSWKSSEDSESITLPASFFAYPSLQVLNLSGIPLTKDAIPAQQYGSLKSLTLNRTGLAKLPMSILQAQNLEELELYDNSALDWVHAGSLLLQLPKLNLIRGGYGPFPQNVIQAFSRKGVQVL